MEHITLQILLAAHIYKFSSVLGMKWLSAETMLVIPTEKGSTMPELPATLPNGNLIIISIQKIIIGMLLGILAFFLMQIYFKLDRIDSNVDDLNVRMGKVETKLEQHDRDAHSKEPTPEPNSKIRTR